MVIVVINIVAVYCIVALFTGIVLSEERPRQKTMKTVGISALWLPFGIKYLAISVVSVLEDLFTSEEDDV